MEEPSNAFPTAQIDGYIGTKLLSDAEKLANNPFITQMSSLITCRRDDETKEQVIDMLGSLRRVRDYVERNEHVLAQEREELLYWLTQVYLTSTESSKWWFEAYDFIRIACPLCMLLQRLYNEKPTRNGTVKNPTMENLPHSIIWVHSQLQERRGAFVKQRADHVRLCERYYESFVKYYVDQQIETI